MLEVLLKHTPKNKSMWWHFKSKGTNQASASKFASKLKNKEMLIEKKTEKTIHNSEVKTGRRYQETQLIKN